MITLLLSTDELSSRRQMYELFGPRLQFFVRRAPLKIPYKSFAHLVLLKIFSIIKALQAPEVLYISY